MREKSESKKELIRKFVFAQFTRSVLNKSAEILMINSYDLRKTYKKYAHIFLNSNAHL